MKRRPVKFIKKKKKRSLKFIKKKITKIYGKKRNRFSVSYKNKPEIRIGIFFEYFCYKNDFWLQVVSHNFFSTSHRKNACDVVGAAAKILVSRASIQQTKSNHILN